MRKSDLIDFLLGVDGDPELFINTIGDHLVLVGNMYVDEDGDIILET